MSRLLSILAFTLFLFFTLHSQDVGDDIQRIIEDYVSQSETSSDDVEMLYEQLYDLYEHPINLNTATIDQLEQIPFITPRQINAFLQYRKRFGQLLNIYELQAVYSFDQQTVLSILPFVTFQEVEENYKRKIYWKHQLLMRTTTVLEDQEGYIRPDSMTHYQGGSYSALLKYTGSLRKDWSWHLTGEQDRGEAWFSHATATDFLSAGLQYQGEKWLKDVVVGDYRLCFGQGLVVNTNFGYGKSSQVLDVIQKGKEIRRSTSSSEYGFFRGGASHLNYNNWDLYLAASSRLADASTDSIDGERVIVSLPITGFHRTESEVLKFKSARINDAVLHMDYRFSDLKIGATLLGQKLSDQWVPTARPDNVFQPHYTSLYVGGLDYKWNWKGVMVFGEAATGKYGGVSGIQGLSANPSSRVGLSLLYRYYSEDYFSPYSQAFGEGSRVSNEEGLYMGLNLLVAKGWSVDTYFDVYRFPWLRFGESRPGSGYDFFFQPNYIVSRNTKMHWRFKYEEKEETLNDGTAQYGLQNTQRLNARYHLATKISDIISLQTRVAATYALHLHDERGYLIYQDIKAKLLEQKITLSLRYALFNTTSYESRIYTYESDVLYLSSIPAFSGKGSRTYLNASYKINDSFTVYFKAAYSKSYDGRTFGSSLDAIDADHKTDVHLQLRMQL